jgi:hypothetical protein
MRAICTNHFNLRYFISSLCYCQTKWFERWRTPHISAAMLPKITSRSWNRGGEGEVFVIPIPAVITHPLSCHFAREWAKDFAASGIDAFSCPRSRDSCLAVPCTMLISLSLFPSSHFFLLQSNLSTFYTLSAFKLLRVSVLLTLLRTQQLN